MSQPIPLIEDVVQDFRESVAHAGSTGTTVVFHVTGFPTPADTIQIIVLPLTRMNEGPLPGQEAAPQNPPK